MPAQPTDSPVSFLRLFWRMGGWLSLIPLVIILGLTLASHLTLGLADRFDTEGRETIGTVIDREISISRDSDGDESRSYLLTIRFDTSAGRGVATRKSTGSTFYHEHDIGSDLPLWYLDSDPDRIELSRGENRTASTITQFLALVFGGLCLVALWFPARRAVAALRARMYGAEETARVLDIQRSNITVNNHRLYRLSWQEKSGRRGQSLAYRREVLEPWQPGSAITVYQGIKRAWWSGDVGLR